MPAIKGRSRRESASTRKRRAVLARNRQGLDGKWESNAKKAKARAARRACDRLGSVFARSQARRMAADALYRFAQEQVQRLRSVPDEDEEGLCTVLRALQEIQVTAKLLKRTLLPKELLGALKRCCKKTSGTKTRAKALIEHWRKLFREDVHRTQDAALQPSIMVRAASSCASSRATMEPRCAVAPPPKADSRASLESCCPAALPPRTDSTCRQKRSASVSSTSSSSSRSSTSSSSSNSVTVLSGSPQLPLSEGNSVLSRRTRAKQSKISAFFQGPAKGAEKQKR